MCRNFAEIYRTSAKKSALERDPLFLQTVIGSDPRGAPTEVQAVLDAAQSVACEALPKETGGLSLFFFATRVGVEFANWRRTCFFCCDGAYFVAKMHSRSEEGRLREPA